QSGDREQLTHRVIAADDGKQGSGQIAQRSGLQHQRQHYQAAEYQYQRTAHGHHEAFGNCQAGPDMADEAEQPGQQSADEQEVEPDLQSKIVRGIDHGCCASSEWPAPSGEWWPSTIHCSTAVTAISYGHWTVLSHNWLHMRRIFFTRTTVVIRYMRPLFRLMLPQTTPPQELSVHGRTAPQRGIALAVLAHVHALLRAGRLRGRGPVLHLPLSGFADPRLDQRVQWPHVRHRLV